MVSLKFYYWFLLKYHCCLSKTFVFSKKVIFTKKISEYFFPSTKLQLLKRIAHIKSICLSSFTFYYIIPYLYNCEVLENERQNWSVCIGQFCEWSWNDCGLGFCCCCLFQDKYKSTMNVSHVVHMAILIWTNYNVFIGIIWLQQTWNMARNMFRWLKY